MTETGSKRANAAEAGRNQRPRGVKNVFVCYSLIAIEFRGNHLQLGVLSRCLSVFAAVFSSFGVSRGGSACA